MIRIGRESQCLPYVGYFVDVLSSGLLGGRRKTGTWSGGDSGDSGGDSGTVSSMVSHSSYTWPGTSPTPGHAPVQHLAIHHSYTWPCTSNSPGHAPVLHPAIHKSYTWPCTQLPCLS